MHNHTALFQNILSFVKFGLSSGSKFKTRPKAHIFGKEDFDEVSAIAVKSGQEILLIGDLRTERRILSFDVNDHSFKMSQIKEIRRNPFTGKFTCRNSNITLSKLMK